MKSRQDLCSTAALAACLGLSAARVFAADPATAAPASAPVPPALQAQENAFGTKVAAAINARDYKAYEKAIQAFVFPNTTFIDNTGVIIDAPKYITGMKTALPRRSLALTETIQAQSTTVTGDTATETGIVSDGEDALDTAGQFGPKNAKHHLESRTSFSIQWGQAPAPASGAAVKPVRLSADAPWKIQTVTFNNTQYFVDGSLYTPPAPRRSNSRTASRPAQRNAPKRRSPRKPVFYVIR